MLSTVPGKAAKVMLSQWCVDSADWTKQAVFELLQFKLFVCTCLLLLVPS